MSAPHKAFDNPLMRRKLPASLDDGLADMLGVIRVNALAERWEACHLAIERLQAESLLARPWLLPLAERMELSVQSIGIKIRWANALEAIGIETISDLLAATSNQLFGIENVGPSAVAEMQRALRSIFGPELRQRSSKHRDLYELLDDWPKPAEESPDGGSL